MMIILPPQVMMAVDQHPLQLLRAGGGDDSSSSSMNQTGQGGNRTTKYTEERTSFAKAALQSSDYSGTFSLAQPSGNSITEPLRKSNLEAAALALADPDDAHSHNGGGGAGGNNRRGASNHHPSHSKLPGVIGATTSFGAFANNNTTANTPSSHRNSNKIPTNKTPMHTQKVILPRPLFFGPNIPPRVVKEAKRIVEAAIADQKAILNNHNSNNSLDDLDVDLTGGGGTC